MKHTTRKTLGVLLALVMVLALLPATTVTAQAALGELKLTNDINVTDDLPLNVNEVTTENDRTITIAEGKTLTVNGNIAAEGKTLTITGKGTLIINGRAGGTTVGNPAVKANLIIDGPTVTIIATSTDTVQGQSGGFGVEGNVTVESGTVTISGGDGSNSTPNNGDGGFGVKGDVTVESGTVTIKAGNGGSGGIEHVGDGGYAVKGNVTVDGGTVTLTGGNGGNGGTAVDGGNGGYAVRGNVTVDGGTVTLEGGNGGNGGDSNVQGGNGGNGGFGVWGSVEVKSGLVEAIGGNGGVKGQGQASIDGDTGCAVRYAITGKTVEESDDGQSWTPFSGSEFSKQYVRVSSAAPAPTPVYREDVTPSAALTVTSEIGTITRVTVDGKEVDSKYYFVSGNSVVLSDAFMRSLSNGTHTIHLYDGVTYATATWTVSGNTIVAPKTADPGLALYAALTVSATLGLGYMGKRKED